MRPLVGGAGATGARKNRWYAAPEPVVSVAAGEEIALELVDGFDGQLTAASTHCDVAALDVWRSHPLTGPVYIEGADPGDVLDVEFLAFEMAEFGATPLIPGVGLLADAFPEPYLVTWEIDGSHARSPALPGVAVPGAAFAGVVGVAPSERLLRDWIRRETPCVNLFGRGGVAGRRGVWVRRGRGRARSAR